MAASYDCPVCGGYMLLRTRKSDGNTFMGCHFFPECRGTLEYYGPTKYGAEKAYKEARDAMEFSDPRDYGYDNSAEFDGMRWDEA